MKALVLGATGHIGAHIVRALLAEGHEVRAAFRKPAYLEVLDELPVERVRVDLDSLEGLREASEGRAWVFHAAAYYPRPTELRDGAIARGTESARRVLESIGRAGPAKVVFTSSAATLRRAEGRPVTERDAEAWPPPPSRSVYAAVKIAMEREALNAQARGLPVVVTNPSVCLGEYDAHEFSGRAALVFARGRMPFYLAHMFNAVYTGDVGLGHVRAAERGRPGARHLLAAHDVTVKHFADLVARAAGVAAPRWRVPQPVVNAAALATGAWARLTRTEPLIPMELVQYARMDQRLDASDSARELGLEWTPLEEAIRRTLAWFREHGRLR
ncbi:MAG TPA: NAD-dependent epimerase/dehydratase family protein [bacterium]